MIHGAIVLGSHQPKKPEEPVKSKPKPSNDNAQLWASLEYEERRKKIAAWVAAAAP